MAVYTLCFAPVLGRFIPLWLQFKVTKNYSIIQLFSRLILEATIQILWTRKKNDKVITSDLNHLWVISTTINPPGHHSGNEPRTGILLPLVPWSMSNQIIMISIFTHLYNCIHFRSSLKMSDMFRCPQHVISIWRFPEMGASPINHPF